MQEYNIHYVLLHWWYSLPYQDWGYRGSLPDLAQVFQFALSDYWEYWLGRLVGYWEQQSTPLAEQVLGMIQSEYRSQGIG